MVAWAIVKLSTLEKLMGYRMAEHPAREADGKTEKDQHEKHLETDHPALGGLPH